MFSWSRLKWDQKVVTVFTYIVRLSISQMRQFYVHVNISCKLHFKVISTNIDYLYIHLYLWISHKSWIFLLCCKYISSLKIIKKLDESPRCWLWESVMARQWWLVSEIQSSISTSLFFWLTSLIFLNKSLKGHWQKLKLLIHLHS